MNYNTVFAPTVAAERLIKGHRLNLSTYALIAAVIVLTALFNALNWLAIQYDRREEYAIRIKLYKVRAHRIFVRRAIAAITFYNNVRADYSALSDRTVKRRRLAAVNLRAFGAKITRLMDSAFCLD